MVEGTRRREIGGIGVERVNRWAIVLRDAHGVLGAEGAVRLTGARSHLLPLTHRLGSRSDIERCEGRMGALSSNLMDDRSIRVRLRRRRGDKDRLWRRGQ